MWIPRTILEKLPNQRRSKKTGIGVERDRARRAAETADQRLRKLRVRYRAINTLLKLLVKDKALYSIYFTVEKYVKQGKGKLRVERNEVTVDERQTGS